MSIQSEINRIAQNIADTYSVLEAAGATMPTVRNSDNLAATAASIPGGSGVEIVYLWENPNPENAFAAQTVSLDLTGIDGISIYFKNKYNSTVFLSTGIIPAGEDFTLFYITSDAASQRRAGTVGANGINFQVGYAGSTASAACCIPVVIYGYKGIT